MKMRPFGKTGLQVSEIGLGAWEIGGPLRAYFDGLGWTSHGWGTVDDDASVRLIHECADMGINFIDTAAGYGAGHSEYIVGRAIRRQRHRWIIETKGGEGFMDDGTNYKDFSREHLLWQIDRSLGRLRTDFVDVYLLHGPSPEDIERGECLEALADIKASGKARFVGVSLGPTRMGLDLIATGAMDVFQVSLNLQDNRVCAALLPAAEKAGIAIVARCAFGAGFLTGTIDETTDFSSTDRRSWQSVDAKASRAETARKLAFLETPRRTLAQACLRYPLAYSAVATVIAGSKSSGHMRENAAASEAQELTPEDLTAIDNAMGRKY